MMMVMKMMMVDDDDYDGYKDANTEIKTVLNGSLIEQTLFEVVYQLIMISQ